ncbi:unnamed protein product [Caenorhabditis bovis]|uniref:Protein SMG9 n=1 Tax=Caenorhabditis bovis TaxID=2654633 RepID=A0A8S1F2P2_9PELO|nr:unnamed protein product [Caenorhabditis bovis]
MESSYHRSIKKSTRDDPPRFAIKSRNTIPEKDNRHRDSELPSTVINDNKSDSKHMKEGMRLISDFNEFADNLSEYFSPTNCNYNVIAAIGPQGSGKSTILSMLAGNTSRQMYREYVFRPVSREANEQSRHQTTKLEIFVANGHIFIDCQPMHSYSIAEQSNFRQKGTNASYTDESWMLRMLALLISVSHTILVCTEVIIDRNIISTIRMAELIRPTLSTFDLKLSIERKTNLVFVHTKAKRRDFEPSCSCIPDSNDIDMQTEDQALDEFDQSILSIRQELIKHRSNFTTTPGVLTERKWLDLCKSVWNDENIIFAIGVFDDMTRDSYYFNETTHLFPTKPRM